MKQKFKIGIGDIIVFNIKISHNNILLSKTIPPIQIRG